MRQRHFDLILRCYMCGNIFAFTAEEQALSAKKGQTALPDICLRCRTPHHNVEGRQQYIEMKEAEKHLSRGEVRQAGNMAGVALEFVLKQLCDMNNLRQLPNETKTRKRIQILQDVGVITRAKAGNLHRLVSIRNNCAHAKDVSEHEVRFLVGEVKKFIDFVNRQ